MKREIVSILKQYASDRTRLIDMLWQVQRRHGYIPDKAVTELARGLNMSRGDIRETSSFYHFFHDQPCGKYRIYLSDTVISRINGYQQVREALEQAAGTRMGTVDSSQTFGLFDTACIGLSDQGPAMLVDDVVFTRLTPEKVSKIIRRLKQGETPQQIVNPKQLPRGDISYVDNMVASNIRQSGPVFFQNNIDLEALLRRCLSSDPEEVIAAVTASKLRGRGGAGFSTGLKWRLCREAAGDTKYVICNADEGEPGTFKDRVLLTRSPKEVVAGMIIAARAIGARQGIIYLRCEYSYLKAYLEAQLQQLRDQGLLGQAIAGRRGFDFDIRIQMGAGAYICGDESALIESCEGKRGTPRLKPPFPVQQGYLGMPTVVNNVETFASVTRLLDMGADWYAALGTEDSSGTRLLSVSGDCKRPGIYEIEWGVSLGKVLALVGAVNPWAVQVSGPSGECVNAEHERERVFAYSDLSCNGSLMLFNRKRDLLRIVRHFMQFFVDESCGICTPCRAGNIELQHKIERLIDGRACQQDLDEVVSWGKLISNTSRCGLGATSPNPILSTLAKFPEVYRDKLMEQKGSLLPSFDLDAALSGYGKARIELIGEKAK
ncbi:NAD(P)H-dependent oxidoreductase subunit E [Marinobacterium jannaschii]|uniref:NAD(P)H-dependent oxidoreductase subunit E n=1 Tax=Marinobacterium jannaschii TaxID=64970 RepID=UPI0004807E77|nr:NAD(P)H-dependent oxidoreductase subunit E [Marinobacterium jannaschii]